MKEYLSSNIRNVALVGHGAAGKTTFAEAVLYAAGVTSRMGSIAEGNTVSDYNHDEIEKKISISTSLLHVEWRDLKFNIVDPPGYPDFLGEVKAALRVSDAALIFVKAVEGIEVGTEIDWGFTKEYKNPSIFVINKVDAEHSSFKKVFQQIRDKLTHDAAVVQFPANEGLTADSVVDVLKLKLLKFDRNAKGKFTESEIPGTLKTEAEKYREELIEQLSETDEELLNTFLEKGELTEEQILSGLRKAIAERKIFPVFAVAGQQLVGVASILDFLADYAPSPDVVPQSIAYKAGNSKEEVKVPCSPGGDTALFTFKTISERNIGELSLFRVYSGIVMPGMDLVNQTNGKSERLGTLYVLNGKDRKEISKVIAGDIAAVVKLKDTHTNNTLSSKNFPVVLKKIEFPEPIMRVAIVSKNRHDEDKVASGLHALHEEDPTFLIEVDPELSQTVLSGQGETHLQVVTKRLKERYGVDVDMVEPDIPYRETIKGSIPDSEYKHKKQSGGRGQYGHVHLKIEHLPRGGGFEFVDAIVGGVVPGRFVPAVEKGVVEAMERGVVSGHKVVDVKVTLFDGTYHTVDSDEVSFKIAGSMAFRKGFKEAKPILLEPIYELEVVVPDEHMGDIMGDISGRRGKIMGMEAEGSNQKVRAQVPLKELYKYANVVRSMTQGRGVFKQKFSHYEEVPKEVAEKIISEAQKDKVEQE
ncbi:MAG TPA: elongation factor G [Candidatus Acidoferrales bacterium]|nr:elongation factor G [Candidatus Acidoferrales bacterium]